MNDWRTTFYAYALILSAALSIVVFWIIWQRRTKPGAMVLSLLMLSTAEWSFSVALEATAITISEKVFWSQISYLGVVSTVPLLFIFTLAYANYWKRVSRLGVAAIWIIPVITFILSSTNEFHHLIWSGYEFVPNSTILIYHHGIAFWVHIVFLYILLSIASSILIWNAIRNRNLYRQQTLAILIAVSIPIITNALYISGFSPLTGADLTPAAFSFSGALLGWAIYKIRLFDITPVESDEIIENLYDGIIILDSGNRIIHANPAAMGLIPPQDHNIIGDDVFTAFPFLAGINLDQDNSSEKQLSPSLRLDAPLFIEIHIRQILGKNLASTNRLIITHDISARKTAELALLESKKRNMVLMENTALPVVIIDLASFSILYANQRIYDLVEQTGNYMTGENLASIFAQDGELQRVIKLTKKRGKLSEYEAPLVISSGRKIWTLISANLIQFENRDAIFMSFNDISGRKLVEETERQQRIFSDALRSSVAALNSSLKLDEVLDCILTSLEKVIPHDTANIMLVDEAGFARVVRAHGYEAVGMDLLINRIALQVSETPNLLKMAMSACPHLIADTSKEPGWVDIDGSNWVKSYIGAPVLVKGKVVGYINLDSTKPRIFSQSQAERLQIFADQAGIAIENARMFETMEKMAIVDMLTGLYNRHHFYILAEREMERYKRYLKPFSVIMMDLDHFKLINDRYGHQAGDYVLQEMARIITTEMRKMDIIGRLGGEEFAILLPETGLDQAILAADRLRKRLDDTSFVTEDHAIHITASMGVAEMTADIENIQMLLSRADRLLYQAKANGRNQVRAALESLFSS